MLLELGESIHQELVVSNAPSETSESGLDSAAPAAVRGAASEIWTADNTFAARGFDDDRRSIFPAEDGGCARDGAASSEGSLHLRRPMAFRPDVRDVVRA
jgi:hypothetical protein